jgi:hypothetical protein
VAHKTCGHVDQVVEISRVIASARCIVLEVHLPLLLEDNQGLPPSGYLGADFRRYRRLLTAVARRAS